MADPGSLGLAPRLDMQQLFIEAQHRWLRPAEICEILRNYQKFHILAESPNRPPSGSLFLFDRKVLRYFRKDGHNWRKKRDGKTVKEAHEKLKVGSIDVLHCYYAHGEDNENFQRRSYWMLEQELMHIVFVHYLEVKGNRTSSSPLNSFSANHTNEPSGNTNSTSPTSPLSTSYEDTDSVDSHPNNSTNHSYRSPEIQYNPVMDKAKDHLQRSAQFYDGQSSSGVGTLALTPPDVPGSNSHVTTESGSMETWEEVFEQCSVGYSDLRSHVPTSSNDSVPSCIEGSSSVHLGGVDAKVNFGNSQLLQSNWQFQIPAERGSLHLSDSLVDPLLDPDLAYDWDSRSFEKRAQNLSAQPFFSVPDQQAQQLGLDNFHIQLASAEAQQPSESNFDSSLLEGNGKHTFVMKQSLLNAEGLIKNDSFSRWVSKELAEVDDLNMRSSSAIAWNTEECGNVVDNSPLSPSLSRDQLFSIIDFSPKWSYLDSETEVHIFGSFLKGREEIVKCNWSCMFGEMEVPAEVLTDGVLCCRCPHHDAARVPFYITNSNRLACSEVREFDYRAGPSEDLNITDIHFSTIKMHLHLRLERLLSVRSSCSSNSPLGDAIEKRKIIGRLLLLKEEGENYHMTGAASVEKLSSLAVRMQLVESQMKEKLFSWLLHKVAESSKGPSVLDDDGQGVLHLAAALGFNWAIEPTVTAGVSINFRDVNGWTALHWAAFYGREETVCVLVSFGAATGALTDPSPECPLGRPPADLASLNGHKGISGFLAESSLTVFLSNLTVNEPKEDDLLDVSGTKAVQTIEERTSVPVTYNAAQDELSLKDSLTALRNATQAASRIYQVYRMQSFQRKKLAESEDYFDFSDERVISLLAPKTGKSGNADGVNHTAATQIQKKYRGWKKRKEFLIIRERIVKIQAHVRGHQVRKQYKPIIWSVGILEKVILRWRRKGSGLRGFRRDALIKEESMQALPPPEDASDVLKEGRKQNEERMQHALTRVKSMIHYPEGRAQYRRLLTVVEGIREPKEFDMAINTPEEVTDGYEDLIDFDSLLDDDTFMSIALENA